MSNWRYNDHDFEFGVVKSVVEYGNSAVRRLE